MKVSEMNQYVKVDYEASLARFMGREDMYARFLKKLLKDETFQKLTEAVETHNLPDIERCAHTLKGVFGNLGLQEGFETSNEIVKAVREGQEEKIGAFYPLLREQMEKYLNVIGQLD